MSDEACPKNFLVLGFFPGLILIFENKAELSCLEEVAHFQLD